MNYRHAFHAGNFADVFKHAVLALVIEHLKLKRAPFRVIDIHAGAGRYDLAGVEAGKTLEWADGIGRLIGVDAAPLPETVADLLAPYLDIVRRLNPDGGLAAYPGSPAIAAALLRAQDRLVFNELHPAECTALEAQFRGDARARTLRLDAWTAIRSLLPPPERRGLLLIDPPFEDRDEFVNLVQGVKDAVRRFQSGTIIAWHPIKTLEPVAEFLRSLADLDLAKTLGAELVIRSPDGMRLNGCGLFIVNPPWTLNGKLETLGPFLAERLAQGQNFAFSIQAGPP